MGEAGFDSVRFSCPFPSLERCGLVDALPLLIQIKHKSRIEICDVSRRKLEQIVSICAGKLVEVLSATELLASIRVRLKPPKVEIPSATGGGLRDVIFAAVLLRVYREQMPFLELIDEVVFTILEELPCAMGYFGSEKLECNRMSDGSIVIQSHDYAGCRVLPSALRDQVLESHTVILHAG
ncbi:hypothetical protein ACWPKS_12880 [Coraliomargarita sp. W4R72]